MKREAGRPRQSARGKSVEGSAAIGFLITEMTTAGEVEASSL